ncbi:hypothetical protein E8E12_007224 [Didymella heteroderae]|uniref:Uncharacterized protein n=1 Tax=Didymella heteroderae TaxID=1769908 RepID=A0A9P4WP26_9PLEO|nr:hypothetical protein E8E12_007224 [Didymella heteroderae]
MHHDSISLTFALCSFIHSRQYAGKIRAPTPEDKDDHEYEPSPKRRQSTGNSSSCISHNKARGTRGIAIPKTPTNAQGTKTKNGATRTVGSPESQVFTEPNKEIADLIVIDDVSQEPQAVAFSSRLAGRVPHAEQPGPLPLVQDANKRKADVLSEASIFVSEPSSKKQNTDDLTLEAVNKKVDACLSILRSLVTHQSNVAEETAEHCLQVIRTVSDTKGSVIENLLKDLESHRTLKTKYRDMVQNLIEGVNLNTGIVFPKEPPQQEVDQFWRLIHEHIVSIVGANKTSPKISQLSAGFVACSAENIAYSRIPKDQLKTYLESLAGPLKSPYAQQTLLSALICRWLLSDSEPMLDTMHSPGMMQLYAAVRGRASTTEGGLATVQQYDRITAKLMFEDLDFQKVEFEPRTNGLSANIAMFRNRWCKKSNIPPSKRPEKFAREAVGFKQRLLLSPKHYRIHYVWPGTLFDPRYMQAYDRMNDPISDAKAATRKVTLCTFPALTCGKGKAVKEDAKIEDVLVKNKRFTPTLEESMDFKPDGQMSKATVLISME